MAFHRIMTLLRRAAVPLAVAVGVGALVPGAAAAASQARAGGSWREVTQISVRGADVFMIGVDAVRPDDAWGLAEVVYSNGNVAPLVEHWNGIRWQQARVPARIVSSFAPTDLWDSIGVSGDGTLWAFTFNGHYLNLTAGHWSAGVLPGDVEAVTVLSRTDVWALGSRAVEHDLNITFLPYAAHFDGRTWRTARIPGSSDISAASAVSSGDIYAVTGFVDSAAPRVLHWNGRTWRFLADQPNFARLSTSDSILAVKHSRVYIGGTISTGRKTSGAFVGRWDGTSWTDVTPEPRPGGPDEAILSLARAGHHGIWALAADLSSGREQIWHRSDGVWSVSGSLRWVLNELSAIPHTESTWASGTVKIRGQYRGVIVLHGPTP